MLLLGPALLCLAVVHLSAVAALAVRPELSLRSSVLVVLGGGTTGVAAAHHFLPGRPWWPAIAAAAVVLLVFAGYAVRRPQLRPLGAAVWTTWLSFGITAALWTVLFLRSLTLSLTTLGLLWLTAAVALLTLPSAVVTAREGWEPLLRRAWNRPRTPITTAPRRFPLVSVHVPCHAEPPDVVIATLDRIAGLDYPNFEVLVIDNNTADETLWRPVEAHCRALGSRFRFLHVQGITGAKAGALNWALPHTDPAAELVAVVDADYHVEPDWLRRTVGYFDEPRMGFVQAPHAYRDFEHSRFGRWANAEYAVFFATGMVALNEHNAGLTVGTMSLLRRRALEEAGGWAEWCLTEDSELAIRIHAAGYDSVYLTETYGRGLIPETFAAYRKQRFRWTYGPVQEIQRHWRLFLPAWLGGRPSALTAGQKLHHANHGIDVLCIGIRLVALAVGAAAATSMLLHHERVQVPVELWTASTALLVSSVLIRFLVYTRIVGASLRAAVGGTVAFAALSLVISVASLKAALRRPAAWQRTAKFQMARTGSAALIQARAETAVAVGGLTAALVMAVVASGLSVITMLAIGLAMQALTYLTAPVLATVADRSLRQVASADVAESEPERLAA
jgi:glycosyltransferase involved in cell wall biosynthesis